MIRWLVTTAAVWVAAPIAGLRYDHVSSLVAAAFILGVINAFVRPLILLLSLPFIFLTMGFGILIVNALLLKLVTVIVPGFHCDTFLQALIGTILISLVSWILNSFIRTEPARRAPMHRQSPEPEDVSPEGMKRAKGRVVE